MKSIFLFYANFIKCFFILEKNFKKLNNLKNEFYNSDLNFLETKSFRANTN